MIQDQILRKDRAHQIACTRARGAQLRYQRVQESDLERKVQTLLEPAVGKDKVRCACVE